MNADEWVGPTVEEQGLFAAMQKNDLGAYFGVLAGTDVFLPCRLDDAEEVLAGNRKSDPRYVTSRHGQDTVLEMYTRGCLPAIRPEGTYFDQNMFAAWVTWLSRQEPRLMLVVNRGSRVEARATVGDVARWIEAHPLTVRTWSELQTSVRTMWNGPLRGDLARSLACGAHLAMRNALPWNAMGAELIDFKAQRESLRDWWGIENVEDWGRQVDALLDIEAHTSIDIVLALRATHVDAAGPGADPTDIAALATAVTFWCREQGVPRETHDEFQDVVGWIGRCEEWLRRDGVLPLGGFVRTQTAWDLGRAVNMARWGIQCGFCDPETAERIILHAGSLCAQAYPTWFDLSAAYILGRVVKMGRQGSPEKTYQESLEVHNILIKDPGSPWRNLPLR